MTKGKFIVIDGTDGTGKATQLGLLVDNLKSKGYKVAVEDFPQYGSKSAGIIEEYLNGVYGTAKELGPYIPSIFFACDRFAASSRIRQNIDKGIIVISNRYTTANMGHQGGKIISKTERDKFYKWLNDLEFGLFKIPKPDLNLILHMPAEVAQSLVGKKGHRAYINKKKLDMHEADLEHLKSAEAVYLEISKKFKYQVVECYEDGVVLTREAIAERIWNRVSKIL